LIVARSEPKRSSPTPQRTFWLLLGFAVLVGIGVVTVLLPELQDQHRQESSGGTETNGSPNRNAPLQE